MPAMTAKYAKKETEKYLNCLVKKMKFIQEKGIAALMGIANALQNL